jgi:hypothetical protein
VAAILIQLIPDQEFFSFNLTYQVQIIADQESLNLIVTFQCAFIIKAASWWRQLCSCTMHMAEVFQ